MKIEPKTVQLKDATLEIRSPEIADAQEILQATIKMADETPYLSMDSSKRQISVEKEVEWVEKVNNSETERVLAAFYNGKYAGNCSINRQPRQRFTHRANIGIALLQEYTHKGIGTALFDYAKEIAREVGIEQLELGVVSTNQPAINLYLKQGFKIVGTVPKAIKYTDGTYADMYKMVCSLTTI